MLGLAINRDCSRDVAAFLDAGRCNTRRPSGALCVCLRCLSAITNREIVKYEAFCQNDRG